MSPTLRPSLDGDRVWIYLGDTPIAFVRPQMLERLAQVENEQSFPAIELRPIVEVR